MWVLHARELYPKTTSCLHPARGGRPLWVAPGSGCFTWFWFCPGHGEGLAGTGVRVQGRLVSLRSGDTSR